MKTKKISKELKLSKQTIALLGKKNMAIARGGEFTFNETIHCSCDCGGPYTVECTDPQYNITCA